MSTSSSLDRSLDTQAAIRLALDSLQEEVREVARVQSEPEMETIERLARYAADLVYGLDPSAKRHFLTINELSSVMLSRDGLLFVRGWREYACLVGGLIGLAATFLTETMPISHGIEIPGLLGALALGYASWRLLVRVCTNTKRWSGARGEPDRTSVANVLAIEIDVRLSEIAQRRKKAAELQQRARSAMYLQTIERLEASQEWLSRMRLSEGEPDVQSA